MAAASPALSIVIPTWNGRELLEAYLPSVAEEAERWSGRQGRACEIVISDDGSRDGTEAWLAQAFPRVQRLRSEVNRGFAPAVNAGVIAASAPLVVLLNNDLAVARGCLDAIWQRFADSQLFGLTFQAREQPAGTFATGGKLGRWRRGFWETWRNFEQPEGESFMMVGGFCAFRRDPFLQIGGFDPVFAPYYSEDLDLSYRARKRGWRIAYEPGVVVHHQQSASVGRHTTAWRRAVVTERNRLLFHWRNLDRRRLPQHALWAGLLLLQAPLRGNWAYAAGLGQAVARWPQVRAFRRGERCHWRRSDNALELATPPSLGASVPGEPI